MVDDLTETRTLSILLGSSGHAAALLAREGAPADLIIAGIPLTVDAGAVLQAVNRRLPHLQRGLRLQYAALLALRPL